jgi:peptidoglycan hydrolase-like protein with peptidoglycan-binding domain
VTRRAAAVAVLLAAAACSRTQQVRESETRTEEAPEGRGTGAGIPPEPGRPRVPASPQALFAEGVVAELQRALARRGLLEERRDGALDPPTRAAIRRLQREKGLAETGFPDRETLKALGIDPERAYVREEDRARQQGRR